MRKGGAVFDVLKNRAMWVPQMPAGRGGRCGQVIYRWKDALNWEIAAAVHLGAVPHGRLRRQAFRSIAMDVFVMSLNSVYG
ncbi:hypothetical protein HNP40_000779 [Mycobacteroides chelonae]|nr:hypothetical protein [Mycobacteroides chelonae]